MHKLLIALLFAIFLPIFSFSQVQKLLDPNPDTATLGSELKELTVYQGNLYAYAESQDQKGLWRLDTTVDKMELIFRDLEISQMAATDSLIFMIASTSESPKTLWISDGTVSGTLEFSATPTANLISLEVRGNLAYFVAQVRFEYALWASDGTPARTEFLHNMLWSGPSGFAGELAYADGKVFFFGIDSNSKISIFETDGTLTGTKERFTKPNWFSHGLHPRNMIGVDSLAYFLDRTGFDVFLYQVRKDTVLRIQEVPSITYDLRGYYYRVHAFQGHHYFFGGESPGIQANLHVMRTDGSINQKDTVHTFPLAGNPLAFFPLPQGLLFTIQGLGAQTEMWFYDGISMASTAIPLPSWASNGREIGIVGSTVLFENNTYQIMRSDGTAQGTSILSTFQSKRDFLFRPASTIYRDQVYFSAGPSPFFAELYRSDGNTFERVDDIENTPVSANIKELNLLPNGNIVFSAFNDSIGQELWGSDGTVTGSGLIKDLATEQGNPTNLAHNSSPEGFTLVDDTYYFSATDSFGLYYYLHKTDGTSAGTEQVSNFFTSQGRFTNFPLKDHILWKDKLYFAGAEYTLILSPDVELYQYDPALNTTTLLKEIEPISGLKSNPQSFTPTNDYLFFIAQTQAEGPELWLTDGSTAGTKMVKEIAPGQRGGFSNQNNSFPQSFASMDTFILFPANDNTDGWQLWRSNGTESGTYPLQDSLTNRSMGGLHRFKDKAIFWEFDFSNGAELWITDGTDSGTQEILSQATTNFSWNPRTLYIDEDICFFTLFQANIGKELWKTDGTAAGTKLVKDLYPGSGSSSPEHFGSFEQGKYVFWATDSLGDRVLWFTDGTTNNTYPVPAYQTAGNGLFREKELVISNDFLYFVAEDVQSGQALFRFDLGTTGIFEPLSRSSSFTVYPNPAQNHLNIRFKDSGSQVLEKIQLLNLQGQVVKDFVPPSSGLKEYQLSLPKDLSSGYYILSIRTDTHQEFVKLMIR